MRIVRLSAEKTHDEEKICHPTAMQLIVAEFTACLLVERNEKAKEAFCENILGAKLSHGMHATRLPHRFYIDGRNLLAARLQNFAYSCKTLYHVPPESQCLLIFKLC